ncbi:MAG: hypothetical protein ACHQT8_08260 [Chlamydiales bacterium]
MKWLYLVLGLFLLPLARFCERETAGFSMMKLAFSQPGENEKSPLSPDVFDQKFYFLGSGGQSFVFASDDGKYVIKMIKRRFSPTFLKEIPLPAFLRAALEKKERYVQKKWERDRASYVLAMNALKEESGLLLVHLHTTDHFQKQVILIDKLGIEHKIDLDKRAFILQKRAIPLLDDLKSKILTRNSESAKQTLREVVHLLKLRCRRGVADEDLHLLKNLGLLNGKIIFIDVGRLKRDESLKKSKKMHEHLLYSTSKLRAWLAREEPALALELQNDLD